MLLGKGSQTTTGSAHAGRQEDREAQVRKKNKSQTFSDRRDRQAEKHGG